MTMKKAVAIGFGGMKASSDEMLAAAQKLRTTKSAFLAPSYKRCADLLERRG
jgi:hypothetical protein